MLHFWIRGNSKTAFPASTVGVAVGWLVGVGLGCAVVDGVGVAEGAGVTVMVGVLVGDAVTVQLKVRST